MSVWVRRLERMRQQFPGLYFGSRPQRIYDSPVALSIDDVEESKRVTCRRYGNCLEYAAVNDWDNFSCDDCTINETLSKGQMYADLEGLGWLLAEIMSKETDSN